ncbi:C40 family peptidase [Yeosuana sp.]|uniref:C40 family peptidase n=1 Tax=Yeosuana sp. TaxID=2529388 RepID=UPI004054F77E|tara:strand:- start:5969 stop:6547 length:579 start_codon:yes stop_codon:yes gene_type:complete
MKGFSAIFCLFLVLSGCKSSRSLQKETVTSSKTAVNSSEKNSQTSFSNTSKDTIILASESTAVSSNKVIDIINYAKQFEGVKYKFGGTTKNGMDCSGLVYEAFRAYNINLPRISRDMALQGENISLENVQEGDLLFFKTSKKRNIISHVGLVITSLPGNIEFIHATSGLGVIISSLAERYWHFSFVEARRMF